MAGDGSTFAPERRRPFASGGPGDGLFLPGGGEPRLDELLDDPIMGLLWRSDRLDQGSARATVLALQALVRDRRPAVVAAGKS